MGDANEADVIPLGPPARLRLRPQPAPLAVCPAVTSLERKRFPGAFARDLLLENALQIFGMQRLPPIENEALLVGQSEEIHVGLVDERTLAVEAADPHRHRRAVGDEAEALLALLQGLLRTAGLGDVDVDADHAQELATHVEAGLRVGAHQAILTIQAAVPGLDREGRVIAHGQSEHAEERFPVVGVQDSVPVEPGDATGRHAPKLALLAVEV